MQNIDSNLTSANSFCPCCGKTYTSCCTEYQKSWVVLVLLCIFFGMIGLHRFYVDKKVSGFVMLLLTIFALLAVPMLIVTPFMIFVFFVEVFILFTLWLIDFLLILFKKFKDSNGTPVLN